MKQEKVCFASYALMYMVRQAGDIYTGKDTE
jgi:hypothetical protein